MLIAKIDNGSITVGDYRELFPNTSFPANGPSSSFLEENNCKQISVFKAHDRNTQKLVPCAAYIEGNSVFTVQVEDKTQDEVQADTNSKAAQLRSERDRELQRSDWRVIKAMETGVSLDTSWATYRQSLRDITSLEGFPMVNLPKAPDYIEPVTLGV
jgi:hypothetical protein